MRFGLGLAALALPFIAFALAQDAPSNLSQLPECALECIASSAAKSSCSITDQACMCADKSMQDDAAKCLLATCTIREALFTKNITSTNCGDEPRSRTAVYVSISNTFGIISAVFILARFAIKLYAKIDLGWDDWIILGAAICPGAPMSVMNVYGLAANGLGRDIWTLDVDTLREFGRFFYINTALYFAMVALVKLVFLLFYLRIFPSQAVRRLLWATIVFTCLYGVIYFVVAIFQCTPIPYYWTRWEGEGEGTCRDVNEVTWTNAAISIALDFWIMAIPLSQVRNLNLSRKKKIGVAIMFCIGAFVTIVSILRLRSIFKFGSNSLNPTWEYIDVAMWSNIEINVGFICACMPSTRILLVRLFSCLRDSPLTNSKATGDTGHHSNASVARIPSRGTVATNGNDKTKGGAEGSRSSRLSPPVSARRKNGEIRVGYMEMADYDEAKLVQEDNMWHDKERRHRGSDASDHV